MSIPKVFISYSHDDINHKKWVLDLATRLTHNGVDVAIDQWDLKPGDDLPHFMESQLVIADKVLMICTENYVQKANSGIGGVGYEKMIVTSTLLKKINENKIIPIVKQNSTKSVPTFLSTKLFIDFSKSDDYEFSFDEMIRTIHNSPLYQKPTIGNNPFKSVNIDEKKSYDGLSEFMKILSREYESSIFNTINYYTVKLSFSNSKVLLDVLMDKAQSLGYITYDKNGYIELTMEGKHYIVNNNLIN